MTVLIEDFAAHHGHCHVAALCAKHQSVHYVMTGNQVGCGEVHQHNIRIHSLFQHSTAFTASLCSGTAHRCHHQAGCCRHCGGIPLCGTLRKRGGAHHFKQIHIATFHGTTRAQRHVDACLHRALDGKHLHTCFSISNRGGDGTDLLFAQKDTFLFGQRHTTGGRDRHIQHPMAIQKLRHAQTGAVHGVLGFLRRFSHVQLDAQAFLFAVVRNPLPQQMIAGIRGVNTAVNADSAIVVAVPLFCQSTQFYALLIGFKIKVLRIADEAIGRKGNVCLDACLCRGLCRCFGEIIQIRHRSDAKPQTLCNADGGGRLGAPGIHTVLFAQTALQRLRIGHIVPQIPQCGSCQMGMAVYKTGDRHHTGTVNNDLRFFFRGFLGDMADFSLFDPNICTEQHLHLFIHCDHGHIGN